MKNEVQRLRKGETVNIQGIDFVMDGDGEVVTGDLYIGQRNYEPHLFTCRVVDYFNRYVVPVEIGYPFNIHECVKVKAVQ